MCVQEKGSERDFVYGPNSSTGRGWAKLRPHLEHLPLRLYRNRADAPFHLQWLPDRLDEVIETLNPSVVHLHWISSGFLQIETLASFNRPVVWTLHDMWAMTGGCHYSGSCTGYQRRCGECPQLGSTLENDLSRLTWLRKKRAWESVDLTVVTPSHWLADCARSSSLFDSVPIKVIPYGIDCSVYKPILQKEARRMFGLPQDAPLILFGAMNPTKNSRKGFDLLLQALNSLDSSRLPNSPELVVFGAMSNDQAPDTPFRTHFLGGFADNVALAALYSGVDVFVAPSREDNLPLAVQESLACGTPVVAFGIGGMPDMINHRSNGYLAASFDGSDLASGIEWCLEGEERNDELSAEARSSASERYALEKSAEQYADVYQSIC
jgi:glycosyltransferase involved in cell wall biosynthesis